jgi:hypothetical protein
MPGRDRDRAMGNHEHSIAPGYSTFVSGRARTPTTAFEARYSIPLSYGRSRSAHFASGGRHLQPQGDLSVAHLWGCKNQ